MRAAEVPVSQVRGSTHRSAQAPSAVLAEGLAVDSSLACRRGSSLGGQISPTSSASPQFRAPFAGASGGPASHGIVCGSQGAGIGIRALPPSRVVF